MGKRLEERGRVERIGEDGEGVKREQGGELTCRAKTWSWTKQKKQKSAGSTREGLERWGTYLGDSHCYDVGK